MVQGDIKVAMSSIAAGAFWTIQPSASESWLIDRVGSPVTVGGIPDVGVVLYNGSLATYLGGELSVPEDIAELLSYPLQVYFSNSVYLRLKNNHSGTQWLTYSGIQTK